MDLITAILTTLLSTAGKVLPIVAFLFGFQALIIRRPLAKLRQLLAGLIFVVLGLGLFLTGLEQALFPLGRLMAEQLTHPSVLFGGGDGLTMPTWDSYLWVYVFAVTIGFGTTIAEPALLAVALKANDVSGGAIGVLSLRVAVATGVAIGVGLGCFRIITGLPLHSFIIAGYVLVMIQTIWAPRLMIPLAYDSGGVTTSTVTVPLITALGLGLAEAVPGRNALLDGFGLVAFASLFPIVTVLAYAQLSTLTTRYRSTGRLVEQVRADSVSTEED